MSDIVDPIIAITEGNTSLHVAGRVAMLEHLTEIPDPADDSGEASTAETPNQHAVPDAELFDATGRRLRLQLGATPTESSLQPTDELVDSATLLIRIDQAFDNLRQVLAKRPALGDVSPDEPRITEVPKPTGATYPAVLDELCDEFALKDGPKDKGNFFHMLAHAAGIAHRR